MDSLLIGNNNHRQDEEHVGSLDKNDIEFKAIKLEKARTYAKKLLEFMLGEGCSTFVCSKVLQMERVCDKITKMCMAHVATTKHYDNKSIVMLND